jgi:hypothetical protein
MTLRKLCDGFVTGGTGKNAKALLWLQLALVFMARLSEFNSIDVV